MVDGTLLPWLRSTLLSTLDTYSSLQCTFSIALLNEVKELCSSRLTRSLPNTVVADIERAFADQVGKICLPQLKLARSKVNVDTQKVEGSSDTHSISVSTAGAEGSVDLAGLVGSGEDFAHSYLLHQLHRMQMSLQHMLAFRLQKLVRPEAAAKTAWLVLVDQARPVVMKLLKVGQWKVRHLGFSTLTLFVFFFFLSFIYSSAVLFYFIYNFVFFLFFLCPLS